MAEFPQSRTEEILYATINGEEYTGLPESRIEELLLELKEVIEAGGGGGGGTSTIAWKPTVASDGTISWTRTASETQPDDQNIKGPKGDTGEAGAKGDTGEAGPQGPKGDDGDDGDPGLGIKLVTINQEGHLIITFDDDTTQDAGAIPVGGAVDSVNGKTGTVTLDAEDVGALPDDTDIPTKTSDLTNDSGFIANTVNNLVNYYLKSETYTKTEIDTKIAAIPKMHFEPVLTLPTEDIDMMAIYLVPKSISQTNNVKDEYINLDGTTAGWELIGDTEVDLSGYVTTTALNTALADYVTSTALATALADYATTSAMNTALAGKADNATTLAGYGITDAYTKSAVDTALAGKVDAVSGKGLSSNDYSNADKAIVDGVTSALAGKADSTDVSTKENLKLASSGTTSSGEIRFGVDGQGNYGYIKAGADSVTPFKNPTGTKSISITANGTVTEDVEDYADAEISVNVPDAYFQKIRKAWSGLTSFEGQDIWTDGDNIYYSNDTTQYVLNKATSTWSVKTWSGLTSFKGRYVWTDGDNIYYSLNATQYVLNKATSTWSVKTWSGLTSFTGHNVWTDGDNIYVYISSGSPNHFVLNKSTSTWSAKTWSGLPSLFLGGDRIWTDGDNTYYSSSSSSGDNHYVLDKSTSTWSTKTWNGYTKFSGHLIWTDGDNIYYSNGGSSQYILDKSTSTWSEKTWEETGNFNKNLVWTDGDLYYFSSNTKQYVLDKIVTGNTWYEKNLT